MLQLFMDNSFKSSISDILYFVKLSQKHLII